MVQTPNYCRSLFLMQSTCLRQLAEVALPTALANAAIGVQLALRLHEDPTLHRNGKYDW